MAGVTTALVGGALLGGVGSALSGASQKKAAKKAARMAQFRPQSTGNLWGTVKYDPTTGQLTQDMSPWASGMAGSFQDFAGQSLDPSLFGLGQAYQGLGGADMYGAYGAANAYGLPPEALYQGALGAMGGYESGMGGLFGAAMMNPYAQEQMALGRGLLGNDYSGIMNERLGLLREQAAPFEQRATDSLFNRLYGQGRLGSTGGGRDIEAFARGLGQADTGRQLDAMSFAEQLYGRDQATGANLFSGGVGNYLAGLGQAGQIGTAGYNMAQGILGTGVDWNQLGYSRAQDRINRAQGMFGFGQAVQGAPAQGAATYMNLLSGLTGEQGNLANQSLNFGQAVAGAGANAGQLYMQGAQVNPFGSFLSGLGGGLMQGAMGGMFGGFGGSFNPATAQAQNAGWLSGAFGRNPNGFVL